MAYYPTYQPQPQQFGGYYQQPQQIPQMQPQQMQEAFACRPVTSREEAVASPADFMRPLVMPDLAHGMVYIKRFNPATGASDFMDFSRCDVSNTAPALDYVTRQEFDRFCADLMRRITRGGEMDDE